MIGIKNIRNTLNMKNIHQSNQDWKKDDRSRTGSEPGKNIKKTMMNSRTSMVNDIILHMQSMHN